MRRIPDDVFALFSGVHLRRMLDSCGKIGTSRRTSCNDYSQNADWAKFNDPDDDIDYEFPG
jgi:hypothetical protein